MFSIPEPPAPRSEVAFVISRVGLESRAGLVELLVDLENRTEEPAQTSPDGADPQTPCGPGRALTPRQSKSPPPPYLFTCYLANVLPFDETWSEKATTFLKSVLEKPMSGLVEDVLMPDRIVLLDIPLISKFLSRARMAKKIEAGHFKSLVLSSLHSPEGQPSSPCSSSPEPTDGGCAQEAPGQYLYLELQPDLFENVEVTQVTGPLSLFCKLSIFSKELKKLSKQMQLHYNGGSAPVRPVGPQASGSPCAARDTDGTWRRSRLTQDVVSGAGSVEVLHVDHGETQLVPPSAIRPLHQNFLRIPVVTYHCALHGVHAATWHRDQMDYLKSLLRHAVVARFELYDVAKNMYDVTLFGVEAECINAYFTEKSGVPSELRRAAEDCTSPPSPDDVDKSFSTKVALTNNRFLQGSMSPKSENPPANRRTDDDKCVDKNCWPNPSPIRKENANSEMIQSGHGDGCASPQSPSVKKNTIHEEVLPAFQCCLHNPLHPTNPSAAPWTEGATEKFHKFIDSTDFSNGELKCTVKATTRNPQGLACSVVDLKTPLQCLCNLLTQTTASQSGDSLEASPVPLAMAGYRSSTHDLEVGSREKVCVMCSVSVDHFYCQLARNSHSLHRLVEGVGQLLASKPQSASLPLLVDSACIARRKHDNETLTVQFIDFGNEATIPCANTCDLNKEFLAQPQFSIPCTFGLMSNNQEQWDKEAILAFKSATAKNPEKTYSCTFMKETQNVWDIVLEDKGVVLAQTLIQQTQTGSNFKIDCTEETCRYTKPDTIPNSPYPVYATCIVGPHFFWCQHVNSVVLDKMSKLIEEAGHSGVQDPGWVETLRLGSPCLALFTDDNQWYRAQVIRRSGSTLSVLFVDYGNEAEVDTSNVKAVPRFLFETAPQAFLCALEGFDELKGVWEESASDEFYELLLEKALVVTPLNVGDNLYTAIPQYTVKVEIGETMVNKVMENYWKVSGDSSQESPISEYC
ncbi:unnamed protein product [Merluccius merluccius]